MPTPSLCSVYFGLYVKPAIIYSAIYVGGHVMLCQMTTGQPPQVDLCVKNNTVTTPASLYNWRYADA